MPVYENVAGALIGTPLERPAKWLRGLKQAGARRRHPELAELHQEDARIDEIVRRVLTPSTHAVDIGCHLGSHLQQLVTLAPRGRHHAFEPVPEKASRLRRKFPGVTVHEMALDERAGNVEFFIPATQSAYSGLVRRTDAPTLDRSLVVRCARFDDVIDAEAKIGYIKIDVNGGELGVLRGAARLLLRDRPFILLGCTQVGLSDYGVDANAVHACLERELGYRIFLPKAWLDGGDFLDTARFESSMQYPFQAFNYAVVPRT